MSSLLDLQNAMAAAILDAVAYRVPAIHANGLSPAQRLGFYRHNVFSNYIRALQITYPTIECLTGSERFAQLALQYIRRYPSRSGDLATFGDQFAHFLSCAAVPCLADMARLEWAMEEAFNEQDHPRLDPERLRRLPLERCGKLRFMLHPAVRLVCSQYSLLSIWQATRSANQTQRGSQPDQRPGETGHALLVWRDHLDVVVEALAADDYAFLAALSAGNDLSTGLRCALGVNTTFDVLDSLRRYIDKPILVDVVVPAEVV